MNALTSRLYALILIPLTALAVATAGAVAQAPDSASLARAIDAMLDAGALARASWGVEVRDVASGRVLYARNQDRLFVPASTLKLIVATAASHHLGPEFRFTTTFLADGQVREGALEGRLLVRGTGDPTISARYFPDRVTVFRALADSLRARGITRITGGLVGDVSWWPDEARHGDWQKYDLNWWYAAPTGPLGFNDNSIDFEVAPGAAAGQPARISWLPATGAFSFENRTRTVEAGRPHTLDFDRIPGTDSIYAYGEIPLGTAQRTESFAVRDPAAWYIRVLGETLAQAGIALDPQAGQVTSMPPATATVLFEYRSPPLPQLVGPVLQTSQNWFAEQLLKTLGKQVKRAGSWQAGLEVEQEFLRDVVGIDTAAFRLRDGSGLSTGNLVAPAALVQLLRFMATSPSARTALDALPVSAAETGSLRNRLTDLAGRVRAKTGSVRNVASLAGVVRNESGRELAFAIVANGTGLPSSRVASAIDQVVRLVAGSRSGS